jgi:hypothetical protein
MIDVSDAAGAASAARIKETSNVLRMAFIRISWRAII